ncbi:1-acyl-sn-glycerol-3-phosphate acyltransferase [Lacticaseibacillus hulanensis]|uniref:1-acyl-sn-glycerol-3-phosphate acyltransferase n=1 Tax=Lacticaseibacillus hulanensis TaxID=2493111 RepID=UPI000FDB3253|nr:1-acyl-sn-glycerol-3-phosphate acyltransferase [Lacticaseibacillus hulanensis]
MGQERVRYYSDFDSDQVASGDQKRTLPSDYTWRQSKPVAARVVYYLAKLLGGLYCRLLLHVHVRGADKLRRISGGVFLYGNHTQPVGDVFVPMLMAGKRHASTVGAPANLGVPVLGRYLKLGGALILPSNLHQLAAFNKELGVRVQNGDAVTIYPEAHVWPYATMIRPFAKGSIHYPVANNAPVFAMTTTYQRRLASSKPRITVDLDGPFWPDTTKPRKESQAILEAQVHAAMVKRARAQNTYEYVHYEPK